MSDCAGYLLALAIGVVFGYALRLWIESREMDRIRRDILEDLIQGEKGRDTDHRWPGDRNIK